MSGGDPGHPWRLPADDFEFYARKWAAQDELLKHTRRAGEAHGLDPRLWHDLEEALEEDEPEAWKLAFARFLEALAEARAS